MSLQLTLYNCKVQAIPMISSSQDMMTMITRTPVIPIIITTDSLILSFVPTQVTTVCHLLCPCRKHDKMQSATRQH